MTVSTNASASVLYAGDGTTRAFAFSQVIFSPADLLVLLYDNVAKALLPTPALNGGGTYDYTITGTKDAAIGEYLSGVTVTMNTAPPAGVLVGLGRNLLAQQGLSLLDNSPFPAKAIEAALDRIVVLIQQMQFAQSRMIQGFPFDVAGSYTLPPKPLRASKFLGFDSSGNVIAALPTPSGKPNFLVNAVPGYYVDVTTSPTRIEQWTSFAGGVPNDGHCQFKFIWPIRFPRRLLGLAATPSFTVPQGWTSSVGVSNSGTAGVQVDIYGAKPGTTASVSILAVGC